MTHENKKFEEIPWSEELGVLSGGLEASPEA
jgi:hypothetical protein